VAAVLLKYYLLSLLLRLSECVLCLDVCSPLVQSLLRLWLCAHRHARDAIVSSIIFWPLGVFVLFDRVRDYFCHGCSLHQLLIFRAAGQLVRNVGEIQHHRSDISSSLGGSYRPDEFRAAAAAAVGPKDFTDGDGNPLVLEPAHLEAGVAQVDTPSAPWAPLMQVSPEPSSATQNVPFARNSAAFGKLRADGVAASGACAHAGSGCGGAGVGVVKRSALQASGTLPSLPSRGPPPRAVAPARHLSANRPIAAAKVAAKSTTLKALPPRPSRQPPVTMPPSVSPKQGMDDRGGN